MEIAVIGNVVSQRTKHQLGMYEVALLAGVLVRRCSVVAALCFFCTGCASSYWADRCRDGADVFTLGAGVGVGAKARIGPV